MSDNTTKIVLHVNNETGKVEKAEQEDADGNRTEATGNFDNVTLKQDTSTAQMAWRMAPQPAPEEDDDGTTSTVSKSSDAPTV